MANTIYDIDIRYNVLNVNQVTNNFERISSAASKAERSALSFGKALSYLGATMLISKGVGLVTEAIFGLNMTLEKGNIQLATELLGTGMAKSFDQATEKTKQFNAEALQFSKGAPGSFQDYLESSRALGVAVGNAGGNMKDLTDISRLAVVASKALGMEQATVQHQMTEALTRNVTAQMGDMTRLLGMVHMTKDQFNKLGVQQRMDVFEKIFGSDALQKGLTAYGQTFEAQWDSLKDNVNSTIAEWGHTFVEKLANKVKEMNEWFENNKQTVQEIGQTVSNVLLTAFDRIGEVLKFAFDHKEALMAIGMAWAGGKLLGVPNIGGATAQGAFAGLGAYGPNMLKEDVMSTSIGNAVGGAFRGYLLSQFIPGMTPVAAGFHTLLGALGAVPGPLGAVATAANLAAAGLELFFDWLDKKNKEQQIKDVDTSTLLDRSLKQKYDPGDFAVFYTRIKDMGIIKSPVEFNEDKFNQMMDRMGITNFAEKNSIWNLAAQAMAYELAKTFIPHNDRVEDKRRTPVTNINNNINVKMQVASNDPDRFAVNFVKTINTLVKANTRPKRGGRDK